MRRTLRPTTIAGAVLLIGWLSGLSWARPPLEYPRPGSNVCVPNVRGFGYFETQWRRWPGKRPVNPRSIGSEVIPAPKGQEEVPPPKATMPRPPSPVPQQDDPLPLPEGMIVPPEGLLLPDSQPTEMPLEPTPSGRSKPLFGDGLPGLPSLPAEPKAPEKSPEERSPRSERRLTPPRREMAARPPAPTNVREGGVIPVVGNLEPERNARYDVPRREPTAARSPAPTNVRDGGVIPVVGNLEPERNVRYDVPRRGPAAARPPAPTNVRDGGVVPVVGDIEPERSTLLTGAYRADSIALTIPSRLAERVEPAAYAMAESPGLAEAGDHLVVPPVALNGYCPVELVLNGRWVAGDLRWTVVHKGLIYRLSGDRQRREFLADPDCFAPVDSGNDRVMLVDRQRVVPGRPEFCAMYEERLYMFSSAASQSRFNGDPQRYAVER